MCPLSCSRFEGLQLQTRLAASRQSVSRAQSNARKRTAQPRSEQFAAANFPRRTLSARPLPLERRGAAHRSLQLQTWNVQARPPRAEPRTRLQLQTFTSAQRAPRSSRPAPRVQTRSGRPVRSLVSKLGFEFAAANLLGVPGPNVSMGRRKRPLHECLQLQTWTVPRTRLSRGEPREQFAAANFPSGSSPTADQRQAPHSVVSPIRVAVIIRSTLTSLLAAAGRRGRERGPI